MESVDQGIAVLKCIDETGHDVGSLVHTKLTQDPDPLVGAVSIELACPETTFSPWISQIPNEYANHPNMNPSVRLKLLARACVTNIPARWCIMLYCCHSKRERIVPHEINDFFCKIIAQSLLSELITRSNSIQGMVLTGERSLLCLVDIGRSLSLI